MKSIDQGHRNFWFCDLLTFLGMLGIFLCHLTHVLTGFHVIDYQTFPTDFLYGLECFVILFFLISGFKIAASVSFDFKQGRFSYPRYLLRRFLGLWPLMMLAILSYLIFRYYLRQAEWQSLTVWDYFEHALLLNGFDPISASGALLPGSWFLGALWIYYLSAPLFVRFFESSEKLLWLVVFAFLIRYLFRLSLGHPWFALEAEVWDNYVKHAYFSCFPFFALGFLGYRLFVEKDIHFGLPSFIPLLGLIVYFASLDDDWGRLSLLFFAVLGTASLLNFPAMSKLKILPFFAKGALGCVLFQMLFLRTMALFYPYPEALNDWGRWWLTLLIVFPALVLLSSGLYYGIEKPLLSLVRRNKHLPKSSDSSARPTRD